VDPPVSLGWSAADENTAKEALLAEFGANGDHDTKAVTNRATSDLESQVGFVKLLPNRE
jgi:hypothetical protein